MDDGSWASLLPRRLEVSVGRIFGLRGGCVSDIMGVRSDSKPMKFEEEISDAEAEEIETEAKQVKQYRRPRVPGLLLTIFSAVIIILVGGLASYYYYTFQSQGAVGEKALKQVWSETVDDTNVLLARFDSIDSFDALGDSSNTALVKAVNDTNQTVRDGLYDIKAQAGLSIKASTAASKMSSFLDDYSALLAELKRILGRTGDIEEVKELEVLHSASEQMSKSYDELLLVGNGIVQEKLSRAIFDLSGEVEKLLDQKIEAGGTKTEQEQAAKQATEQVVSQFVQAWQSRDPEGMSGKLTAGAKREFQPGIVEDSTEIINFRITESSIVDDVSKAVIVGQIEKETPDSKKVTENWEFIVLKQDDKWLIDRWTKKA